MSDGVCIGRGSWRGAASALVIDPMGLFVMIPLILFGMKRPHGMASAIFVVCKVISEMFTAFLVRHVVFMKIDGSVHSRHGFPYTKLR